jgi:hypothetical protein
MKTWKYIICFCLFVLPGILSAQQGKGYDYWIMENDSMYTSLLQKHNQGDSLSLMELSWLNDYQVNLKKTFDGLPDAEKANYYQFRLSWANKKGNKGISNISADLEDLGDRSAYIEHLLYSGYYGFYYGLAFNYIFNIRDPASEGIPILSAGISTIIPMVTIPDKRVTTNALLLGGHGKFVGGFQGAALGVLLTGTGKGNYTDTKGKAIAAIASLSSIGLGRLGYKFGEEKGWSQGQVALYRHYGLLMPLEGMALGLAFESEDIRTYSALSLGFGAAGYLIANKVGKLNDYTRGDVISIQGLTLLNAWLGGGIVADIEPENGSAVLYPALLALGGTVAGQLWLKDARLTTLQGRVTMYAASGGAFIGLGIVTIANPISITPYYLIPYLTGLASYSLFVNKFMKENTTALLGTKESQPWNLSIAPQNILLNKRMGVERATHPDSQFGYLPAITASLRF